MEPLTAFFVRFRGETVAPHFIARNNGVKEFPCNVATVLKELPETAKTLIVVIISFVAEYRHISGADIARSRLVTLRLSYKIALTLSEIDDLLLC